MPDPLTQSKIDELEKLCEAATEEPWETAEYEPDDPAAYLFLGKDEDGTTVIAVDRCDAKFIAAARTALPRLLAELKQAREGWLPIVKAARQDVAAAETMCLSLREGYGCWQDEGELCTNCPRHTVAYSIDALAALDSTKEPAA